MRSISRNLRLVTILLAGFMVGIAVLAYRIYSESSFYISNSGSAVLGKVYDRNDDVLFDQEATPEKYGPDHFTDVSNFIGNDSGQMTNTLVSENMELLSNYSFSFGVRDSDGKSAVYTTLDHEANQKVYNAFDGKNGAAIAYNYITGEILICVSRPGLNPFNGYENLEDGSLLCKAFYKFTPGSTQKTLTLIAAHQVMGEPLLSSKRYSCSGVYVNKTNQEIICHKSSGHGEQDIAEGFSNSCNPFFAQLTEDPDFFLDNAVSAFKRMGYSVNGSEPFAFEINNIAVETASTVLTDKNEFSTQWGFIGQGETMISPCMLMVWQSAIASSSGKAVLPYIIDRTTDVIGNVENHGKTTYSPQLFPPASAEYVKNIMIQNGQRYTDTIPGYTLGLKSGTAQVKHGDEENSFLVGFDTNPDHPVAFCILIEDRKSYEVTTDSIAYTILNSVNTGK